MRKYWYTPQLMVPSTIVEGNWKHYVRYLDKIFSIANYVT